MSVVCRVNREKTRRFWQYWDDVLKAVPEARREAVKAVGEAVEKSLHSHIQSAELSSGGAKERVSSWQELRLGSGGGWAAVSPRRKTTVLSYDSRKGSDGEARQHTWKGKPVTAALATGWLERGHGTKPSGPMVPSWSRREGWHQIKARRGSGYVAGRQFYSRTKQDALELALKAADRALCRIADELD